MTDFIATAFAETAGPAVATNGAAPQSSGFGTLIFLGLFFVFFYLFFFRPQTKRAKEHRNMLSKLEAGDEVVTSGGILGVIAKLGDNFVDIEIAEGVQIKVQKGAISSSVPKGTLKAI
jgi:preprotein translocase subunit YajC